MAIQIDPEQLGQFEGAIDRASQKAAGLVKSSGAGYGAVAGAWKGQAANAAMAKHDEFDELWRARLWPILDGLREGLGIARTKTISFEEDAEQALRSIPTHAEGNSGMSRNYEARM